MSQEDPRSPCCQAPIAIRETAPNIWQAVCATCGALVPARAVVDTAAGRAVVSAILAGGAVQRGAGFLRRASSSDGEIVIERLFNLEGSMSEEDSEVL